MTSNDVVIQVENLGKCYFIFNKPIDRIKQLFSRGRKQYYRPYWALRNVNFEVKRGESLGIIGRNGSGKSTLLQLICNTLTASEGKVDVKGRVAALLELGSGFNPEFTGRENIFLNGAILGFTKSEMMNFFPKIESFAEIGEFIDQPVKTYSSGMYVRLAFAIQACVEPDILIVDEALSVGDIFFQQKCAERMRQLREKGTTLIFVSHDMGIVRDLCEKVVYLKEGKVNFYGESNIGIGQYFREGSIKEEINLNQEISTPSKPLDNEETKKIIQNFKETACWLAQDFNSNSESPAKILAISITDLNDVSVMSARMGSDLKIRVLYQVFSKKPVHVTIVFKNRYGQIINASGSYTAGVDLPMLGVGEYAIFDLKFSCMIEAGEYTISVVLGYASNLPNRGDVIEDSPWIGPLVIQWDYENNQATWFGMFAIPYSLQFVRLGSQ